MLRQSPFHARVAAANQTSLWSHWAGHLVVDKYQMSEKWEYVAIRNAVGVFDSSPLYKYRITGPDAERYPRRRARPRRAPVQARPGPVHDLVRRPRLRERGRRGVPPQRRRVLPHGGRAEPVVLPEPHRVTTGSRSTRSASSGGRSRPGPAGPRVLSQLAPEVSRLGFFDHTPAKLGDVSVWISRTGFTGDLGYEVFCDAGDAHRRVGRDLRGRHAARADPVRTDRAR